MIFKKIFFVISGLIIANVAFALDKDLGISKKFRMHMYAEMNNKVCNAYSVPLTQSNPARGKNVKMHITNRPYKMQRKKLSINMGVVVNQNKPIEVRIDNRKYKFFAHEHFIFPFDKDEKNVISRMRNGRTLTVKLYNQNDVKIEDKYSLRGFTKALSVIDRACRKK